MRYNKRHAANAELKEYLMSVIGNAPYGLIAIDLEGFVVIANDLATEYLDIPGGPKRLIDQPILPLIGALPSFRDMIQKCLEMGRKEFDMEQVSHEDRFLDIRGRLILNGLLLTIEEITRRVRAEQELKIQAVQLAASNKELEEFAWLSSHDMKSPIISLDGLMTLMARNKAIRPEQAHLFDMARKSTRQMRETIMALNQIIAFRKTLGLEKQKIAFKKIWDEVTAGIQQSIVESGAVIRVDFSAAPSVCYPPVHLKSILQNLLTNAIKYKRKDKPPVIRVVSFLEKGATVLEFSDEGMGIDLKLYGSKLYGIFQRFHTHTEGMGVGLHMIHSIVKSYGGKILIKSKINQGTTFKIHLDNDTVQQDPVGG